MVDWRLIAGMLPPALACGAAGGLVVSQWQPRVLHGLASALVRPAQRRWYMTALAGAALGAATAVLVAALAAIAPFDFARPDLRIGLLWLALGPVAGAGGGGLIGLAQWALWRRRAALSGRWVLRASAMWLAVWTLGWGAAVLWPIAALTLALPFRIIL
jgi:hypothetical protein